MLPSSEAASSSPPLPLREEEMRTVDSPYAQAELKAADCMRVIREYISQIDALSPSDDPALRNDLLLNIRKSDNTLRRLMLDAKRHAAREQKARELKELQHHCTATQALVRSRYNARAANAAANSATVFTMHDDKRMADGGEARNPDGTPAEPYDLHQDTEFAEFFARTKERDLEIDVALDRIHDGVLRVNDNAHGIQDELHAQDATMKDADKKVDENQGQMASMNKKMAKAIKKLGKSRLITYCVMCVILVVLIIVIVILARSL